MAAAHAHFCRLGWDPAEVHAGQMDSQLDALLARACAMQAHAKHLENLPEHARAYHAPPTFMCVTFHIIFATLYAKFCCSSLTTLREACHGILRPACVLVLLKTRRHSTLCIRQAVQELDMVLKTIKIL